MDKLRVYECETHLLTVDRWQRTSILSDDNIRSVFSQAFENEH